MASEEYALAPRWTPLIPHPVQMAWMHSKARFNVVPAGRRSGKTERAKRKLVRKALSGESTYADPRYFAAAPTRQQAKDIWWRDLKSLSPRDFTKDISESELTIKYINGSSLHVLGMDKPERMEGSPWDGGVLDEFANMKKGAWGENVRPALSDRRGWCDLIGVPEGRNHYYELYEKAFNKTPGFENWAVFQWKSIEILGPEEVESARRELDPLTFQQEYEASFLNFAGRIYYPFERALHVSKDVMYFPHLPLIFCFDFNVSPGVAVVAQEQSLLPNGISGTAIISEVHIPRNSNTPAVCRKLIHLFSKHSGLVYCYGDSTGGNSGTAKLSGSDWDIIKRELNPVFGERLKLIVPQSNPPERSRVNAVNTRLLSGLAGSDGEAIVRLMIHPACKQTIRDFEGVQCLDGGTGEIDKDIDDTLTHLTDAVGYYIAYKFPIAKNSSQRDF